MRWRTKRLMAIAATAIVATPVAAQPAALGYHTAAARLGSADFEALLHEPDAAPRDIALVFTSPNTRFNTAPAEEMARRGYRVVMVRHFPGTSSAGAEGIAETARAVAYARGLPGVRKVVLLGHGDGAQMQALYTNAAAHGPAACQGARILSPCREADFAKLPPVDGIVMIEPAMGAFHAATTVDPAWTGKARRAPLDMFAPANGFDLKTGAAHYDAAFLGRYYAAQSVRNEALIAHALSRRAALDAGKGYFTDDEPLVIPGAMIGGTGASAYRADTTLLGRTHAPHLLLKGDGTTAQAIVVSIRPAQAVKAREAMGSLNGSSIQTTVREFLAKYALRTQPGYRITADTVEGVDWASSMTATPANAEGIAVPALVMTMSCNVLVTTSEIVFDHLASPDKSFAAVEGAVHQFTPCGKQYGDTQKRTFDHVAAWLEKPGRF